MPGLVLAKVARLTLTAAVLSIVLLLVAPASHGTPVPQVWGAHVCAPHTATGPCPTSVTVKAGANLTVRTINRWTNLTATTYDLCWDHCSISSPALWPMGKTQFLSTVRAPGTTGLHVLVVDVYYSGGVSTRSNPLHVTTN